MLSFLADRGFQSLVSASFTNHFAASRTANSSAGQIENGKKHTANHKTPWKIAAELTLLGSQGAGILGSASRFAH
jgi:hypothetical protein